MRERSELLGILCGPREPPTLAGLVAGRVGEMAARLLGEGVQWLVERVEQVTALPEAEGEHDDQRRRAHDQAAAQLVEMIDDAQPVLMTDWPQALGHRAATSELLGAALGVALGRRRRLGVLRLLGAGHGLGLRERLLRLLFLVLAGDSLLELAHAVAETTPELRQLLRADDQQQDNEDKDAVGKGTSEHFRASLWGPSSVGAVGRLKCMRPECPGGSVA